MITFSLEFQSKRFETRQLWVQGPSLPLKNYVALVKFLKLTMPEFPHLYMGNNSTYLKIIEVGP